MANNIKIATIRQVHKALVADGYLVSENALRRWIKSGDIPAKYSGNTAYIAYEKVLDLLLGTDSGLT